MAHTHSFLKSSFPNGLSNQHTHFAFSTPQDSLQTVELEFSVRGGANQDSVTRVIFRVSDLIEVLVVCRVCCSVFFQHGTGGNRRLLLANILSGQPEGEVCE